MKYMLSITIEEDVICQVRDILRKKTFKNKSQFFEKAAKEMIKRKTNV